MTIELLQTLSLASYIVSIVFALIAIALFFLLNIPKVFGEVSGITAKRAIEKIRQQNEMNGNKLYESSSVNKERGKKSSVNNLGYGQNGLEMSIGTEKLSTQKLIQEAAATTVLGSVGEETTVLSDISNETTVLSNISNETTVLSNISNETTVLNPSFPFATECITQEDSYDEFTVDIDIGFLGSSEIIE